MIEKLEIIGRDVRQLTEDEFTSFMAEEVCKFTKDAPEGTSSKTLFMIELTLAMFSAQITNELFKKED